MISVLHVIDRSCDETVFQILDVVRSRMPAGSFRHAVCSIHGPGIEPARLFIDAPIMRCESRVGRVLFWAPRLAAVAKSTQPDVLHAWGAEAAAACHAAMPDSPLVVSLINPAAAEVTARWIRSLGPSAAVSAGSQTIRTRLLQSGIAPERAVVIRGPVDFRAITQAREAGVRRAIAGDASPVLLLSGPPSRAGGQFMGLWAAAIVRQIHRGLRVVMPYGSAESLRLQRFARTIGMADMLVVPERGLKWPDLVAAADVFLVPAVGEICTEPIGWAMAGGVPVVGSAVRSIAELIADRSNGLLCKPGQPRVLAARLLTGLEDEGLRRKVTEVARGQAYEVFSTREFCDNYARLYENVAAGRFAGEGLRDTAMVG